MEQEKRLTQTQVCAILRMYRISNESDVLTPVVLNHQSLIKTIAHSIHPTGPLQVYDLIQEGNLALMLAVQTYDCNSQESFDNYATNRIRKRMRAVQQRYGACVTRPYNHREDILSCRVDSFADIDDEDWSDRSLPTSCVEDETVSEPEKRLHEVVERGLATLNADEVQIIRLTYGFDGDPASDKQIAQCLHCSAERVRQIREIALRKLRVRQAGCTD